MCSCAYLTLAVHFLHFLSRRRVQSRQPLSRASAHFEVFDNSSHFEFEPDQLLDVMNFGHDCGSRETTALPRTSKHLTINFYLGDAKFALLDIFGAKITFSIKNAASLQIIACSYVAECH